MPTFSECEISQQMAFAEDGICRGLKTSLTRLDLNWVDILAYRFDLSLSDREAYPTLVNMREEGLVESVGVGLMYVDALVRAATNGDLGILIMGGWLTLAELPTRGQVLPSAEANEQEKVAAGVLISCTLVHA